MLVCLVVCFCLWGGDLFMVCCIVIVLLIYFFCLVFIVG